MEKINEHFKSWLSGQIDSSAELLKCILWYQILSKGPKKIFQV